MRRCRIGFVAAACLALAGLLGSHPQPGLAQTEVEFSDVSTAVDFGQSVTFQAAVDTEVEIQEAYLTLQPQGLNSLVFPVEVGAANQLAYRLDLASTPLRPFSRVHYSFRLLLNDGSNAESAPAVFDYTDTRFDWQVLRDDSFEVYWYDQDLTFGQLVLNTAQTGLKSIQNIIPVQLDESVRIYVYSTSADLKGALPNSQSWIAGQSAPDLGVVLVSIPAGPEEPLELERQVPHELMHVMLYRQAGEQTANLPAWLLEGLASAAEIYPNPEYTSTLEKAAAEDQLIPLENLCGAFPTDASDAFLAYAESASFVRYPHRSYGSSAMRWLVEQYQNGLGCSEGIQTALGASLSELEYHWKQQDLRIDPQSLIFRNLLPYLLLFLVLFGAAALTIVITSQRTSRKQRYSGP
jgi:hypothetical protein